MNTMPGDDGRAPEPAGPAGTNPPTLSGNGTQVARTEQCPAQPDNLPVRTRAAIHEWVRRHGRSLLGVTPFALVAAMTAAALSPIALPLLAGNAALALTGLIAQLGNIGAEHVARVMRDVITQLRGEAHGAQVSEERLHAALSSRLEQDLGGPQAAEVQAWIGGFLHEIGGVGTALDAAIHGGVEGLYAYIGETVHLLGQSSVEFRALRGDVLTGLAAIQGDLARVEAMQRGQAERIERVSTQIAMLHRHLAVGRGPVGHSGRHRAALRLLRRGGVGGVRCRPGSAGSSRPGCRPPAASRPG